LTVVLPSLSKPFPTSLVNDSRGDEVSFGWSLMWQKHIFLFRTIKKKLERGRKSSRSANLRIDAAFAPLTMPSMPRKMQLPINFSL
jgi:hypothetical protein